MSISKSKRQKIERAIEIGHQAYSCIAHRYGVSIKEVKRIGKPIRQKQWQEYKAKKELERVVANSTYDRKPYPTPDNENEKLEQTIKVAIILAIVIIGCLALCMVYLACLALGA